MSSFLTIDTDSSEPSGPEIYRVMIVDDSAFIRGAIARAIESDPCLRIVVSVSNGEQAIRALQRDPVDVIVLDIEMPVMDGMTALPQLKAIDGAVQIIMASTLTQKNAEISLKAMSLGATDYIPKPSSSHEVTGAADFRRELVEKVKALGGLARRSGVRESLLKPELPPTVKKETPPMSSGTSSSRVLSSQPSAKSVVNPTERAKPIPLLSGSIKREVVLRRDPLVKPNVVAIGSSTGGPQALFRVIKDIGPGLPQPIVITQHMPPSFTTILADHITRQCGVTCKEAQDGDLLQAGHFYVAPGDFHMLIEKSAAGPKVKLVKDPPENFCRPSVDPMLRSLLDVYGRNVLVAILTGMGQDGARGSEVIVKGGGSIIAQDEATSVVWGMPGAVATLGLCSAVLPVNDIGGFVRQTAMRA
ncbi:MAG: chemotaxis response regulator protein-glutamate methylesterase [Alphaproteobacteria bacterium]|nr:chemotaxis response regulator protein-glutamate methylesterase [Alphaproteobacteria bacterium]